MGEGERTEMKGLGEEKDRRREEGGGEGERRGKEG